MTTPGSISKMARGDAVGVVFYSFPVRRMTIPAIVESVRDDGVFAARMLRPAHDGSTMIMLNPNDRGNTWE